MTAAEQWDVDPVSVAAAEDKAVVDSLMADMKASYAKWEEILEAHASVTFEADFGDIYAMVDQDGRLLNLRFASDVMSTYTFIELQARVNALFDVLAQAVYEDQLETFGGVVE